MSFFISFFPQTVLIFFQLNTWQKPWNFWFQKELSLGLFRALLKHLVPSFFPGFTQNFSVLHLTHLSYSCFAVTGVFPAQIHILLPLLTSKSFSSGEEMRWHRTTTLVTAIVSATWFSLHRTRGPSGCIKAQKVLQMTTNPQTENIPVLSGCLLNSLPHNPPTQNCLCCCELLIGFTNWYSKPL